MTTDKMQGLYFVKTIANFKEYETTLEGDPQMLYEQVKSIKEVQQNQLPDAPDQTDVYTYEYDEQGKILEYNCSGYTDSWREQHAYNADGLREESWICAEDTLIVRYYNKYDERGLLLEQRLVFEKGETLYRYFYNGKGQLERRASYDDEIVLHTNYVYNELGQLVKTSDDERNATHYKYNAQGQLIEEDLGGGNKWVYEYNPKGFLATETYYSDNKKGSIETHIYTYDKQGNWISRETYIEVPGGDKWLSARSTRTITYY